MSETMDTQIFEMDGQRVAVVHSDEIILSNVQDALDFLMTVRYDQDCTRVALNKEAIAGDFFVLSTGFAGAALQKFVNYRVKFAIYGDFSGYTSKPLQDFIRESNRGNDIFFVATAAEAVEKLAQAKVF